jgi:hypothetical protein
LWKWFDKGLFHARLFGNDAHFGTMDQVSHGMLSLSRFSPAPIALV